jgi:hypothetical protein
MLLFPSTSRAPGTYTREFLAPPEARAVRFDVAYTAEGSASSTLDFKIQYRDADSWRDIVGASLAQFTGVAESDLAIDSNEAAVANRSVDLPLPRVLRAVAVVGTNTVTFAVNADFLP